MSFDKQKNELNRNDVVQVLISRMDKCITDHLWIVTVLVGFFGAVMAAKDELSKDGLWIFVFSCCSLILVLAVIYILNRHLKYYEIKNTLAVLLKDEDSIPSYYKVPKSPKSFETFPGVALYLVIVIVSYLAAVI